METAHGKASDIRSSVKVSGGEYGIFASSSQITLFSIGKIPVIMVSKNAPVLQEGDEVIVGGKTKNGRLEALAYQNISTSSSGDKGYIRYFIAAFILFVFAIWIWYFYVEELGFGAKIASGFLFLIGIYFTNKGIEILKAIKEIQKNIF